MLGYLLYKIIKYGHNNVYDMCPRCPRGTDLMMCSSWYCVVVG